MTVPDEVYCPICENKMSSLNEENEVLNVNTLDLSIDGEKKKYNTKIFFCKNCNNIQSFLVPGN